jgi:ornithine decarboxylase
VLDRLVGLGSCFDAASFEEVEACLDAGAAPESISYGNTVKKESAIRAAYARGVRMFAFDSEPELRKLARSAPGARVYCRILVGNDGAEWPLSRKFGCEVEMARELMVLAGELGLDPVRPVLPRRQPAGEDRGLRGGDRQGGHALHRPARRGVKVRMVNLGGGYPVRYRQEVPEIDDFAAPSWARWRSTSATRCPTIVIEPGRFIVGDAGVVSAEVVLVSRKAKDDPVRWVYLDIGRFGGLARRRARRSSTPSARRATARRRGPSPSPARPATARTRCTRRATTACRSRSTRATGWSCWRRAPTSPATPARTSTASRPLAEHYV